MFYLAANNSRVHKLAEAGYPLGWIMSPAGFRNPRKLHFANDNGLFFPFGGQPRGMKALVPFYRMLDRMVAMSLRPMFVTVPDVPYDGARSLALSRQHRWHVEQRGFTTALAVQDGMTPDDIDGFAWLFVAGSTKWKWATMPMWVREGHARGMRVHVARVNTRHQIDRCIDAGADCADGTGIFRGDKAQLAGVLNALVQQGLWGQRAHGWDVQRAPAAVAGRDGDGGLRDGGGFARRGGADRDVA